MSYVEMEAARSRKRYEDYLDEQDSSKLPNAFDLGWRRNLRHLFGPNPLLWFVPVCNTIGDGWAWEASPKWIEARDRLRAEREQQRLREVHAGWGDGDPDDEPPVITRVHATEPSGGAGRHYPAERPSMAIRTPSKADRILGRDPSLYADGPQDVPMRKLSPRGRTVDDELDEIDAEDEEHDEGKKYEAAMNVVTNGGWKRGGASGVLRQQRSRGQTPSPGLLDDGVD
jgi:palmitoyltransferase